MTFVKVFGVTVGALCLAFGIAAILEGVNGVGPCRISCAFNSALLSLVGQATYSVVYGAAWALSGLAFICFILFRVGKTRSSKRGRGR
jgi:hypothetical protein